MAFKLPEIFSRTDAKSRMILVLVTVVGVSALIYVAARFLGGGSRIAPAKVANAPSGLQSVPGGQLTPEYYRALMQANAQTSKQAQISGGSSVPTLVNVPGEQTSSGCTTLCPGGEAADVTQDLNDLVSQGKLSQDDANKLLDLAKNNVSVDEYATQLDALVKAGKLTPEQARKLLDEYKRQHANAMVADSAATMDSLIKSGKLSVAAANELLDLQKQHVTPEQYADTLNRLVREGKMSPEVAAQLLAQYTQQRAQEAAKNGVAQLQDLVNSGQLSQEAADDLSGLQKRNATVAEYSDELNKLVAAGKITPAMAAKLLAQYQAQRLTGGPGERMNALVRAAAADATPQVAELNNLVAAGKISQDTANALADLQKRHVSPAEYQQALDELVKEGKISPEDAKNLMQSYALANQPIAAALPGQAPGAGAVGQSQQDLLDNLVKSGKLSPEAAQRLADLANKHVSPAEYQQALDELVKEGKLSPEDAKRLMANYVLSGLQGRHASPAEYQQALDDLVKSGKLSPEEAKRLMANYVLSDLQNKNATPAEYQQALDELVRTGKLTPAEAKQLMTKYQKLQDLQNEQAKLASMQGNNASVDDYAKELQRAVAAGILSPEDAAKMLQEYQAMVAPPPVAAGGPAAGFGAEAPGGTDDFSKLQQRLKQQNAQTVTQTVTAAPTTAPEQFAIEQAQAQSEAAQRKQERIKALMSAMSTQAQALVTSWQPVPMTHTTGAPEEKKKGEGAGEGGKGSSAEASSKTTSEADKFPIIKAGTILFAVLDTAVNSDFPDTPVMATIIQGKYKGAKVLGKLALAQGQDRVTLNFTAMDMDDWPKSKAISAYAIDPDTAHTVLASNVDYHYLQRYGAMIGSAFLSGYASAISSSASTSTTGIFGTSTTHPALSPGNKLAVGLGQVGTTVGTAVQGYINTPATVKVDAGVGLGILFVAEVKE